MECTFLDFGNIALLSGYLAVVYISKNPRWCADSMEALKGEKSLLSGVPYISDDVCVYIGLGNDFEIMQLPPSPTLDGTGQVRLQVTWKMSPNLKMPANIFQKEILFCNHSICKPGAEFHLPVKTLNCPE